MGGIGHADVYPAGASIASGSSFAAGSALVRGYAPGGATALATAIAAVFGVGSVGGASSASAAGTGALSGVGSFVGGGGGALLPSAPLNVTAFSDATTKNQGAAFILFGAPSSNGGSPITGYVGTAYQGGVPISTTVINPSPIPSINALSCRIDFPNLAAGTYQFSAHAVNANGAGPESALSAATTVSAVISPYYIANNGLRAGWGTYGAGYNYTDATVVYPGQTSSLSLAPGGYADPFFEDPFDGARSGPFNLVPYLASGHFVANVYVTSTYVANGLQIGHRANRQVYGQCTQTATAQIIDTPQNWTPNGFVLSLTSMNNITTQADPYGQVTANTANTATIGGTSVTFNAGDFYEWSNSDIDFANQGYVAIDPYVVGGGPVPVNTWFQIAIPMSAFPNHPSTTSPGCIPNFIQEAVLGNASGNGKVYIDRPGYSAT